MTRKQRERAEAQLAEVITSDRWARLVELATERGYRLEGRVNEWDSPHFSLRKIEDGDYWFGSYSLDEIDSFLHAPKGP